jgi:hypothetical protein
LGDSPASGFYVPTFRNTVCSTYGDGTECSETSEHKILTPGNHPKERLQHFKSCSQWQSIQTMTAKQYRSFYFLGLPRKANISPTLHYACVSSRCCSVDCVCSACRNRGAPCGTALNGLSLPSFLGNKPLNWHQKHDVALKFKMCAINGNDSVGFTTATLNIKQQPLNIFCLHT